MNASKIKTDAANSLDYTISYWFVYTAPLQSYAFLCFQTRNKPCVYSDSAVVVPSKQESDRKALLILF